MFAGEKMFSGRKCLRGENACRGENVCGGGQKHLACGLCRHSQSGAKMPQNFGGNTSWKSVLGFDTINAKSLILSFNLPTNAGTNFFSLSKWRLMLSAAWVSGVSFGIDWILLKAWPSIIWPAVWVCLAKCFGQFSCLLVSKMHLTATCFNWGFRSQNQQSDILSILCLVKTRQFHNIFWRYFEDASILQQSCLHVCFVSGELGVELKLQKDKFIRNWYSFNV